MQVAGFAAGRRAGSQGTWEPPEAGKRQDSLPRSLRKGCGPDHTLILARCNLVQTSGPRNSHVISCVAFSHRVCCHLSQQRRKRTQPLRSRAAAPPQGCRFWAGQGPRAAFLRSAWCCDGRGLAVGTTVREPGTRWQGGRGPRDGSLAASCPPTVGSKGPHCTVPGCCWAWPQRPVPPAPGACTGLRDRRGQRVREREHLAQPRGQ